MMDVFILQALLEDPLTPGNLNGTYSMAAGSGSALIAAFLVYPADMLKTRLIVQNINPSKSHYRGIVHGFRKVWKAEGFLALYKGLLPTFLGKCFRSSRNSLGQVNNNSCFCMYCLGNMAFFGLPHSMFCFQSPNRPIWGHVSYTGCWPIYQLTFGLTVGQHIGLYFGQASVESWISLCQVSAGSWMSG